ncbi:hypothetical protein [Foetidibacter luteolus]|uniref:hypothetical protein n=1 Tax=Foetidibacter luteolus TaxID=2608880 RepID=UPI00129B83B5|nr:hypothetical protein [Foetidibacter luteolus]
MKKIFVIAAGLILSTSVAKADPNEKLVQSFNQTFPNAQSVKWSENDNGYLVSFTQTGTLTKIRYDKEGNFLNSLRYYQEKDLPLKVLLAVKKKYKDKSVFGVTELTNENGVTYQLTLNDDKKWYIINSTTDGDLSLKDSYTKSE